MARLTLCISRNILGRYIFHLRELHDFNIHTFKFASSLIAVESTIVQTSMHMDNLRSRFGNLYSKI